MKRKRHNLTFYHSIHSDIMVSERGSDMDKGKWISRKNISVKPKDIDKVSNLRWRYECSECGFEVKEKNNECPKCHKQMSEN